MEKDEIEILTSNVTIDFLKYELRKYKALDITTALQDIENVLKHQQEIELIEEEMNRYQPGEIRKKVREMQANISRIEREIHHQELIQSIEQIRMDFTNLDKVLDAKCRYEDVRAVIEARLLEDDTQTEQDTEIYELRVLADETRMQAVKELLELFQKSLSIDPHRLTIVIPSSLESPLFKAAKVSKIISINVELDQYRDHFNHFCENIVCLIGQIAKSETVLLIETESSISVSLDKDASLPKSKQVFSLNAIALIINFLNQRLHNFSMLKLGLFNNIWQPTCQAIISNYLQLHVPSEVDKVIRFEQDYTLIIEDFLNRITYELYTGEILLEYLSSCLDSVMNQKTGHYVEKAKQLLSIKFQGTLQVGEHQNKAESRLFDFPACLVHTSIVEIKELIDAVVLELGSHHDKIYSIVDLTLKFRFLAQRFFSSAIDSQKYLIGRELESAEGLDCEETLRFDKVTKTIHQLTKHFQDLNVLWKPIIPSHLRLIGLGQLVDHLSELLTNEILILYDITEVESNRLAGYLALEGIQAIFRENLHYSMINHYTGPKYAHFVTLVQLLTWSMSNIMECWRLDALNDFETKDLVHLITALFSDTELRRKNIKEIESNANT
ncbi:hypothetical protein HDV01_007712 [Terramyces sp. JEL0728]|nr:hypothetical protein HDV01_007712 [Terramyces sp. JEL0728]